jgi:CheY-like chemotaxis protein
MPRGGIVTIASENYHHTADEKDARLPLSPGFYVKVSIEDQGNGIPESQLPHIFKPYHTSNSNGRSLGLATTFTVIHNHGGHIIAESPKGKGTKFTFYLPATGQTRAPEQKPIDLKKDGEKKGKSGKNGKILVIDDEKSIRDLATTTLKMMGCEVVACESSSKGVERFINDKRQGTPFDLILMDLTIPGDIGGNEAMQQILSIAPNARGIASSGYSEGSVMAHFRQYGFQAALSKPYNIGDLQRMVSNLLSN